MSNQISVLEFFKEYPDDDACLEHLMETRYGKQFVCPKCEKDTKFHKVAKRPVYACQYCGHQISPMAGTPFERSRTPLQKWFYAIYLFTTSRHGMPAKELQRQLSVTYKTAWRMGHEIRKYMGDVDGDSGLSGHVEVDETLVGGRKKGVQYRAGHLGKTAVFGMVQRDGHVITRIVHNRRASTLTPHITDHIARGSTVSSDTYAAYKSLHTSGYIHGTVDHGNEQWVNGIHHTNTIEGFWSRLKTSIRGTHIHVSPKYLANYLAEFEYRYNMRATPSQMFDRLLQSF